YILSKTRVNGEGNIRLRADGRWEVRITVGYDFATGKPKRISRYTDKQEEAVKLLHELSFIRETSPKNFHSVTLGEWLDLCLNVYMKNTLKQSTYSSYEGYIRVHFKPALGNILLKDITPRLLQHYYNYKSEQEGLAPKTIVNLNLFLHKALSYAVNEGYIMSNPAASINLPRGDKPQIEILTRDEQLRLVEGSYQHRYGVFIRLVLFTGIRLGELLGLRWEDVDFSSQTLYIRRTLNRLSKRERVGENGCSTEIVIQSPKSQNSIRRIPLLPGVVADLQNWNAIQNADRLASVENYEQSGFVVTNPMGKYIEPRTFKDYYNQILQLSGLPHFTFHALRHTFASRAMEQGMDAKTLSMILGHASVSFTLDTYTHVLDDHKREGMALMNELYT
ncbi:MAG: site-specific integrase, partial [Oscillospiraceae bacterium]|nr:site-specific integrase [Oscillospiraceae bacterium]